MIFLLAVQLAPASSATPQQEVVITARRLKDWRGKLSGQAGGSRCKTTKSTGDRDLDRIACDSLRYCMARSGAEFLTVSKAPAAERSRLLVDLNRRLEACGEEQQQLRVAELVEQRWEQKAASK